MRTAGIFQGYNVVNYGFGVSTILTHSEALALMEYHSHLNGQQPPASLTFYNDRETCGKCLMYLPLLLRYIGIQQITIINKNGTQHTVNANDLPSPNSTPPDAA